MALEINKIYCADCLDLMKEMEDNSVDLVLTDPPYGIGMDGGSVGKGTYEQKTWDACKPSKGYFNEIQRVSKNQIIFGGNYFTDYLPASACWLIWDKRCGIVPQRTYADCELCWSSYNVPARIYRYLWDGFLHDKTEKHKEKREHPTQKPCKLIEKIIKDYSEEGQTIFDPFLGSGTTAVACINTGRNFIGIEKDADYFEIAQKRIKEAQGQTRLF